MSLKLTYLSKDILPDDLKNKVTEFERAASFLENEGFYEAAKELLLQSDYIIIEYTAYKLWNDINVSN